MKNYIVSVLTTFGRDGRGEFGYHEIEVLANNEDTAISAAKSNVISDAEPGTVIVESHVLGYYETV